MFIAQTWKQYFINTWKNDVMNFRRRSASCAYVGYITPKKQKFKIELSLRKFKHENSTEEKDIEVSLLVPHSARRTESDTVVIGASASIQFSSFSLLKIVILFVLYCYVGSQSSGNDDSARPRNCKHSHTCMSPKSFRRPVTIALLAHRAAASSSLLSSMLASMCGKRHECRLVPARSGSSSIGD
ncbi:unnamed protein product [Trichogramma brassicae]|uniref:Uncharacterized protein n=1 Tax=Trichogramma brassicae TaxID=86971 RepID=A0A6H5IS30_9HYME|nr:unnamed protein product [Trichogramma brassicae]